MYCVKKEHDEIYSKIFFHIMTNTKNLYKFDLAQNLSNEKIEKIKANLSKKPNMENLSEKSR